ncbi:helix-turn-helix domain-containing protein [Streptomyces roseifaciens]
MRQRARYLPEQPGFGARLREIRQARGMMQAELAGPGMSPAYLSRLESGNRPPTERALAYLCDKLGVPAEVFRQEDPDEAAQRLAVVLSGSVAEDADVVPLLLENLERPAEMDPAVRWQALWVLAEAYRTQGDREQEEQTLRALIAVGAEIGNPRLEVRARVQLARYLQACGRNGEALDAARRGHAVTAERAMPPLDAARALLVLVSLEADAGRLAEAAAHTDELLALVAELPARLRVEALWTASTVRVRQKRRAEAVQLLEQAMSELTCTGGDLTLWLRLRLAVSWLYLQMAPRDLSGAERRLREAGPAVELLGSTTYQREFFALCSYLAFYRGGDARAGS